MKIKEIEERSGMARANIRFYESEGLIHPKREKNGYREYSEEDLEVLKKIKLLRMLQMSLEEIKELHTGEERLLDALERHIQILEERKNEIEQSQITCKVMREDKVTYETLNAQYYLDNMGKDPKRENEVFREDQIPKVQAPWRRYFARLFDYGLCMLVTYAFFAIVFHINIGDLTAIQDVFSTIISLCLMLFLEPLCLSRWGTTPGKWLLGLRVWNTKGECLRYSDALARTWTVIVRGLGFRIPLFTLFTLYNSFRLCKSGETLYWEDGSILELVDTKKWRIPVYIGCDLATTLIMVLILAVSNYPIHQGSLTKAEFAENYNDYAKYYNIDDNYILLENGAWKERDAYTYEIVEAGDSKPTFHFMMDGDQVIGLEFDVERSGESLITTDYQKEMYLASIAYLRAKEEYRPIFDKTEELLEVMTQASYQDFSFEAFGTKIDCDVEYTGFHVYQDFLWPNEEGPYKFTLHFQMYDEGK